MEKPKKKPRGKPFPKGNPGKTKGTLNKVTRGIKDAITEVFNDKDVGGVEGLKTWVLSDDKNREKLYDWMVKLCPKEVSVEATIDATITHDTAGIPELSIIARQVTALRTDKTIQGMDTEQPLLPH